VATIQLNPDWRVKTDLRNWILQKRATVEDADGADDSSAEPGWKNVAYYGDLPDAVKGMVKREIKVPADMRGVLDKLEDLHRLIDERFFSVSLTNEEEKVKKVEEIEDFLM
jgi:hypothetical protein